MRLQKVLILNENLDLGSVRSPLEPLHEDDKVIAKEAAELIQKTRAQFL